MILRVAVMSAAEYLVHQHRRLADAGIPEKKVNAALVDDIDTEGFDPIERHVLRLTEALVNGVKAPEELLCLVQAQLSNGAFIEVLVVVGVYIMISRLLVSRRPSTAMRCAAFENALTR